MTTAILLKVLGWVLPVALGPIVYIVARQVLNATRRIDDLAPWVKRIAVIALGTAVSIVFSALGIVVPIECAALPEITAECAAALNTSTVIKGVTAALVAMILHTLKKSQPWA